MHGWRPLTARTDVTLRGFDCQYFHQRAQGRAFTNEVTRMNKLLIAAVAGSAVAAPTFASPRRDNFDVSLLLTRHRLGLPEALATVLIADALNLDVDFILSTKRSLRANVYDLAPVFYIHRITGDSCRDIWNLRNRKRGWGYVLDTCGIDPCNYDRSGRRWRSRDWDSEFIDGVWMDLMFDRYGRRWQEYCSHRKAGRSWQDVIIAAHIADLAGCRCSDVFSRYSRSRNWDSVRAQFNICERWDEVHHGDRCDDCGWRRDGALFDDGSVDFGEEYRNADARTVDIRTEILARIGRDMRKSLVKGR